MENLPEALISEILKRIYRTSDRNAFSMVSSRLCTIEANHRDFLRVGCGLHPATDALTTLCLRFQNISKLEVTYSGWMSNMGKQLDNQALFVLSSHCPKLVDLTLSFCSFINDSGLSYLASLNTLSALKLNFIPGISSNGLLSVAVGCKNLSSLQLIRCMKVSSVEWLEYIGKNGNLQFLSIKNCRGLGQDDIVMLGPGWRKIRHLEFAMDTNYRYWKVYNQLAVGRWRSQDLYCENMRELSLINCTLNPGSPYSYIFERCKELENLSLNMCNGVEDSHMTALSQNSFNLRRLSLHLSPEIAQGLSDVSLMSLARKCSRLEEFELSFPNGGGFPSFSYFTQNGILTLIRCCPIRVLTLENVCIFDDIGMEALSSACFLIVVELVKCQEVTDEGIQLLVHCPSLKSLKLCQCLGVSDFGLKPFVGSGKLDWLIVEDCIQVSEKGVEGAARNLSYGQDLSWLC